MRRRDGVRDLRVDVHELRAIERTRYTMLDAGSTDRMGFITLQNSAWVFKGLMVDERTSCSGETQGKASQGTEQ
jgi:hypothetical protein